MRQGHDDECVKYLVEVTGRIVMETPPEMSKWLQTNDLYINGAIQTNLEKKAAQKSITDLINAAEANNGKVPPGKVAIISTK